MLLAVGAGVLVTVVSALLAYPISRWLLKIGDVQGCLVGLALYLTWATLAMLLVWQINFDAALAITILAPLAFIAIGLLSSRHRSEYRSGTRRRRR